MSKRKRTPSPLWSYISLIFIGIGIGCLIGLSISPVVSIVISSVTGTAAAIIAAMSGLPIPSSKPDEPHPPVNRWQINPIPFALLILGLLIGIVVGLTVRNTHYFGSDVSIEIAKWVGKTDLSEKEITERIFEARYPKKATAPQSLPQGGSVLFALGTDECDQLYAASLRSDDEVTSALESVDQLAPLVDIVTDPQALKEIVQEVLCQ